MFQLTFEGGRRPAGSRPVIPTFSDEKVGTFEFRKMEGEFFEKGPKLLSSKIGHPRSSAAAKGVETGNTN